MFASVCLSVFRSHAPIYFFSLYRLPLRHPLHALAGDRTPSVYGSSSAIPPLASPSRQSIPSVRGTNRRVPRDTLVSRALAGEKSRNDVTLLGRNRESRESPGRRDHPVRQEPRVFPGTRADRGFQVKSARQGRRVHPGQSGPSGRRVRQDFRVSR